MDREKQLKLRKILNQQHLDGKITRSKLKEEKKILNKEEKKSFGIFKILKFK